MLVGHSQLPASIISTQPDIFFEIFRAPGAQLKHINREPLINSFECEADLVIVFLGGNDITRHANDTYIAQKLKEILLRFKSKVPDVRFVPIEYRNHASGGINTISPSLYNEIRKKVNGSLRTWCKRHSIRTVNIDRPEMQGRARDGIHFSTEVKQKFVDQIITIAKHSKANQDK